MISTTLNSLAAQINSNSNKYIRSFLINNSSTISSLVAVIASAYFLSLYFCKKTSNSVILSDFFKRDSNANASESTEVKSIAIGVSNPVSLLQERQFELINKMQVKGLIFENIPKTNTFICDNSFIQIKKVLEDFSELEKKDIGRFFYSPENNAICCNLDEKKHEIAYPRDDEWTSLIKISKKNTQPEHSPLALSDGKFCSEKEFIENSLFASTLEKHSVFRHLCKIQETQTFKKDYQTFLTIIQSNDDLWANSYSKNPIDLAYLSLFAYLDGKIVKEELFIIQMLASSFLESPDSTKYVVLTKDNVKDYLLSYNYLTDKNKTAHLHCLENLDKKSLIERTAFSKQSENYLTTFNTALEYSVYQALESSFLSTPSITLSNKKSLKAQENKSISTLFLPPWLGKRLNSEIASVDNTLIDHEEYFGYRRKLDDLLLGRPISYASPLFYIPEVHNTPGTQLGITSHDVHFHCFLDFHSPYAKKLIQLGQKVRSLKGKKALSLAVILLDREMNPSGSIVDWIDSLNSTIISTLSLDDQKAFFCFCKEILAKQEYDEITNKFDMFQNRFKLVRAHKS